MLGQLFVTIFRVKTEENGQNIEEKGRVNEVKVT
jgi:hypothetical protein